MSVPVRQHTQRPVASGQVDHRYPAARSHQQPKPERSARRAAAFGASKAPSTAARSVVSPAGPALLTDSGLIQHRAQPPETSARTQTPMRVAVDIDEGKSHEENVK